MYKKIFPVLICSLMMSNVFAEAKDIIVLGLFKDKVVLKEGGKRHVLKVGESIEGVKVISVNSKRAVLSVDGETDKYELGMQIHTSYQAPQLGFVQIPKDTHGMYRVDGTINGRAVNFLVDTGATLLAINANQASVLGIDFEKGEETMVETASGRSKAYLINLQKVAVGDIILHDVDAVVVDGSSPKDVLLGMTFLSRVNIKHQDSLMVLEEKY